MHIDFATTCQWILMVVLTGQRACLAQHMQFCKAGDDFMAGEVKENSNLFKSVRRE